VNRIAGVGAAAVAVFAAGAWWMLREEPVPPPPVAEAKPVRSERVVGLEQPLPQDATVELRWVDEETGEEDVWQVTKREGLPEALTDAEALPEPDPEAGDHVPDESARVLHDMGLESWKRGEIREAMGQFEKAIETDPDDRQPRTQYGRLLLLAMSYHEARPHLERAAELEPEDPQVWLDLATLYEKMRLPELSWDSLERAREEFVSGSSGMSVGSEREVPIREFPQDPITGFYVTPGTEILP
jgi:tetratricopeptide (TPR) repeat protein